MNRRTAFLSVSILCSVCSAQHFPSEPYPDLLLACMRGDDGAASACAMRAALQYRDGEITREQASAMMSVAYSYRFENPCFTVPSCFSVWWLAGMAELDFECSEMGEDWELCEPEETCITDCLTSFFHDMDNWFVVYAGCCGHNCGNILPVHGDCTAYNNCVANHGCTDALCDQEDDFWDRMNGLSECLHGCCCILATPR
jgi:hypothetical protein